MKRDYSSQPVFFLKLLIRKELSGNMVLLLILVICLHIQINDTYTAKVASIAFQGNSEKKSSTARNLVTKGHNVKFSFANDLSNYNGKEPFLLGVTGKAIAGNGYSTADGNFSDFSAALLSSSSAAKAKPFSPPENLMVNFQDSATRTPNGWLSDFGQPFGLRTSPNQGTGNTFGWIKRLDNTPLDLRPYGRQRSTPADTLQATLIEMQASGVPESMWEVQVTNGNYEVTVSAGDGAFLDSEHFITVENVPAISNFVPTATTRFSTSTVSVTVTDGRLSVYAPGGMNTKINYIAIRSATAQRPSVVQVNPENGSQNVSDLASISTSILNLPNGGINNATLNAASVYLEEQQTRMKVAVTVNGSGGGDAITLVPKTPLNLNMTYVFHITDSVKDLAGASFIPFSSTFTIDSVTSGSVSSVKFTKVKLANTTGKHSSLTIGPDRKLYALSIDGVIKRFVINPDGTLQDPQLIYSLQDATGTRQQRLAIGFVFDPESTPTNLIAYVTHSSFAFQNAPDWDGKITRLSGPNLQNVQHILVNLPRSTKDHLTNSLVFGPDGALYFPQGSASAMGRADNTWGMRNENMLSATVLRLDLRKLGSKLPLDVKTKEGGGNYNPFAADALLTIYASGVRNAYDLVWHSNGELYVPTNGSAAGGNTPASVQGTRRPDGTLYVGPQVPALTNVQQTQKDFIFRVKKGGYYGHPNSLRGEYVMNGGNPTTAIDPAQVASYPVGTKPDPNWRGFAFDFQMNKSPNGIIEYKSNTFGGALKGKLLVVRYSQNDDIITLTPGGSNKDIVSFYIGASIQGFSGFVDPLDLIEDTRTGNIYVSEYGGDGNISLLKHAYTNITTSGGELTVREQFAGANSQMVKVSPNPVHQKFTIEFPIRYKGNFHLHLIDNAGRVYVLGKVNLVTGGGSVDVNAAKLNFIHGIYFLRISSDTGSQDVIKLLFQ